MGSGWASEKFCNDHVVVGGAMSWVADANGLEQSAVGVKDIIAARSVGGGIAGLGPGAVVPERLSLDGGSEGGSLPSQGWQE